jgi:hypothetical protein
MRGYLDPRHGWQRVQLRQGSAGADTSALSPSVLALCCRAYVQTPRANLPGQA